MTISAPDGSDDEETLAGSIELYRGLSRILRWRVAALQAQHPETEAELKATVDDLRSHCRALQSVIDLEARLGKQRRSWLGGTTVELDLAGARAEILARLGGGLAEG